MGYNLENILEPAPFLVENINILPKGRVLDIAMGNGRNAIYLAKLGYIVEGIDISAEAVDNALKMSEKAGVSIQARIADLEKGYKIPDNAYDIIICFNYLQRSLIPQIKSGVRRKGMVVYETFTVDQVQFGKPKNPDFLLKYNELLKFFQDFRCLRYREGVFDNGQTKRAIASIVAEKE